MNFSPPRAAATCTDRYWVDGTHRTCVVNQWQSDSQIITSNLDIPYGRLHGPEGNMFKCSNVSGWVWLWIWTNVKYQLTVEADSQLLHNATLLNWSELSWILTLTGPCYLSVRSTRTAYRATWTELVWPGQSWITLDPVEPDLQLHTDNGLLQSKLDYTRPTHYPLV